MKDNLDISVVIGFKDWGKERLVLSIESILASFGSRHGEVIVSDFGSETFAPGELQQLVESVGAVYVRTETDGVWSRSRAVNAGYSASRGSVVVATDADMLFTPLSMERVAEAVQQDPTTAVVLQCRDLPEGYDQDRIASGNYSFPELHRVSQIRPRWGMGGMFAAHRDVIADVGGYDNRMHTYGGEDLDLALRVRRSGRRVRWIEHDDVRMYHIWHEPTIKGIELDAVATQAVQANRTILRNDPTWKRNTTNTELREHRISWAQEACHIITPALGFSNVPKSTFILISPADMQARGDIHELVSQKLDTEYRALVGQIVAFETPDNRTKPNWEVAYRLPVLVFDSRFAPLVSSYFGGGRWDILGAARRLQASGINIGPSSEVFGLIGRTPEMSEIAARHDWEWSFAPGLFPKRPGPRAISELLENIQIEKLAEMMPAVDVRVSSDSVEESSIIRPITDIATEWAFYKNELTGEKQFEAIIVAATEEELQLLKEFESEVELEVSQIHFGEAVAVIEQLSSHNLVVNEINQILTERDTDTGALEVAWIDNPIELDETTLAEIRVMGGALLRIQNTQRQMLIWVAPEPLIDVEGRPVSSFTRPKPLASWNRGIIGPLPLEALVALGGKQ
jgi:hypothetical protein